MLRRNGHEPERAVLDRRHRCPHRALQRQGTSLALAGDDLTLRSAGDFDLVSDHVIGLTAGTSAVVQAGTTFMLEGSGAGLVQAGGVLST
jgi:hypothetical protein